MNHTKYNTKQISTQICYYLAPNFLVHMSNICCHFSQNSFVLETSILLPPSSLLSWPKPTTVQTFYQDFSHHGSNPKTTTKFISSNNANSLKAAIFNTMAFKLSLEINTDQVTFAYQKRSFLKVLYNVCKIKKKNISLSNTPAYILMASKLPYAKRLHTWSSSLILLSPQSNSISKWQPLKLVKFSIIHFSVFVTPKLSKSTTQTLTK